MLHLAGLTSPPRWRMRFRVFRAEWNTVCLLAWRTWPLLAGRMAWKSSKAVESRARWSFKMRVVQFIKSTVRPAGVVIALVAFTVGATAQQPSAAAVQTAKEIVDVTGATALFNPLIAGVVEQAKNLFL